LLYYFAKITENKKVDRDKTIILTHKTNTLIAPITFLKKCEKTKGVIGNSIVVL